MIDAADVISEADSGAKGCEDTALVAWDAVLVAISADIANVAECKSADRRVRSRYLYDGQISQ
jgi:hypothetical protein